MDHNLDTLNLDSAMGVDFESSDHVEVSQADLSLASSSHEGIPMEFEHIEEQPNLMETGSEEIIDFMGGEFTLQEYSVQDDQTTGLTTTAESNQNVLTSQAETMLDLQLQPQTSMAQENPKIISVKAAVPARAPKIATAAPPRQVAIAPKPPRLATKIFGTPFGNKQFAIAPKPVTLVKKVSIGNVVQGNTKGNTVLAQIGKQLVVMPAGTQKLKLMAPTSSLQYLRTNTDQATLIQTKDTQPRPVMMTKVIVQGQQNVDMNQPAVITKILPTTTAPTPQARFVALPQKTVPIAIGNKVLMASPTKQGVKLGKKQQIIAIQSPTAKLLPAPTPGVATKKVVLTTNPTQNVILKTTAPPKTAQIGKDSVLIDGQHTQLHQINVPGKGIQYIRLVTQNTSQSKPSAQGSLLNVPSKFVLTDNKAGGKKLVRIAPVMPKTSLTQPTRSSQSLLAPLSPSTEQPAVDINDLLSIKQEVDHSDAQSEQVDSKAALQSLIENTIGEESHDMQLSMSEVEIDYKRPLSPGVSERRSADVSHDSRADDHQQHQQQPLIVIQSGYDVGGDVILPDNTSHHHRMEDDEEESQRSMLNMETDMMNSNDSSTEPQPASETEMASTELGLRPRKACNCTKSQCLKLYCDCFANGEFCNRCNCNNCHNNLENEELRQKAIRGCLDRNPNAFRPKIGKAKSGGPEIVRRHNKGCNCKRSGCLKNYCECYEAKIACTAICKCVGCRNVEESLERFRRQELPARPARPCAPHAFRAAQPAQIKQPCSFMTSEVIEAVCQCLVAAAGEPERGGGGGGGAGERDPLRDVIDEFARCLQDIIGAAHHAAPPPPHALLDQGTA